MGHLGAQKEDVQEVEHGMDPTEAVKQGVRDYHRHCVRTGFYYATPTDVESQPDEGKLTRRQRREHDHAVACLVAPRRGVSAWASA